MREIEELFLKANLLDKGCGPPVKAQKMTAGMTNENYLCTLCNGEQYVARFPGKGTAVMINRKDEGDNQILISKLGLNIEILYFDKDRGTKITKFINDVFPAQPSISSKIALACGCLKELHESDVRFKNSFWVFDKFRLYETIAHSYGITLSPAYVKTKSKLLNFQKMLLENLQWKPCHNDPVLENFIMSEDTGIYLIDWEYSGMNDYTWDLAAFALENNLNQDEENFLWSCYWGDDKPDTAIIKIKIYKICQDLLWYVWAKIKEAEGSDFSGYAQMRLERGCLLFKEISKND